MMTPESPPQAPSRAANAVLGLLTLATFVAWIHPPLLDSIGLEALARWMMASALHRIAVMPAPDGLAFQVIGPQTGRRLLSAMLAPLQSLAISMAAAHTPNPEAQRAIAALSFLGHPEVPTGQPDLDVMVSLRTNRPDEA